MSEISKQSELIFLELGQIIQINATENLKIHEKIFIIDYLDNEKIDLIQQDDLSSITLNILDGNITDESIESIFILDNPVEKGYAKQNDLIPPVWVSIYFEGEIPLVINGQITDIEEDMIEITQYPDKQAFYIDFEYKGIPKDLNIVSIQHIEKPQTKQSDEEEPIDIENTQLSQKTSGQEGQEGQEGQDGQEEDEEDEDLDLELYLDTEEQLEHIKEAFIDLEDIIVEDEDMGEITEQIHVSEKEKRYSVEMQTGDLLDELLASIPSTERTKSQLNKVHIIIERFKQLRKKFSKFDKEGNAEHMFKKGSNYKPLVENFKVFNKKLEWIIPVIKNKKNLYDKEHLVDENDDDSANILGIDFALSDEFDLIYQYLRNNIPDGQNKYEFLYQNLNQYFTPNIEPNELTNIIQIKEIESDFDVILDNISDFYSTTMSSSDDLIYKTNVSINQNRFVMQRLNTGLTHLVNPDPQNKKSILYTDKLTSNDTLFLKGFFTLPNSIIKHSRINLPSSSIYDKSNLNKTNFSYFKVLNELTNFKKRTIIENEEPINHSKKKKKKKKKSKDVIMFDKSNYIDFEELRKYDDRTDDVEIYDKFLNTMIPNTKKLFQNYKSNIKNGVSFYRIIQQLEPFLIYSDDITFKQYNEIMSFVYDEIEKIKKKIIINKGKYTKYLSGLENYESYTILSSLLDKIKTDDVDIFAKDAYNISDDMYTDTSIKKIIDVDCGRTYLNALALGQMSLVQPIDLENSIKEELDSIELASGMGKSSDCDPIILAKKYNDIEDLERDSRSDVDIFFDRKYDDTPYDIGNVWREKQSDIEPEELVEKLSEFLVKNNGLTQEKALRDASAMILGAKHVENGDYALLDLGDMDYKYYVRQNNKWKLDKSLEGQSIDTVNFCNLKDSCIQIKKQCIGLDESKEIIRKNFLSELTSKLEQQIRMSISELTINIKQNFKKSLANINNLKKMKTMKNIQRDIIQLKIASTLDIQDVTVSPYAILRDTILSQNDLIDKLNNILLFIEKYCREHDLNNTDESEFWYYCIDTDTKLLPTFYQSLGASIYHGVYEDILAIICDTRGQLSDDNGKIIDKHSGYIIKLIEFDDSEGYDASGYKIVSREIMIENVDIQSFKYSNVKDSTFDYQTRLAKHVSNLLHAFDKKLQIDSETEHSFMVRLTIECLNKNLMDEKKYNELVERKKKKGKKVKPYETKHDEILLKSVSAAYIIGVQCATPNIVSDVTFSICIKSFNGYPLNGNSDLSFVNYFNCLLVHLKRGKDRPWKVLPRVNKENFQTKVDKLNENLHIFMNEKVINIDYVVEKLQQKRLWNMENKDIEFIPESFDVQQWSNYLPPLIPIQVSDLQDLGEGFEDLLKKDIRSDNVEQFYRLWNLYGNIVKNCFSIFESVQKAINNEPMILASADNIPFLENACCNEGGETSTYYYFTNKEKSIEKYNERVRKSSEIYEKYVKLLVPSLFVIDKDTKLVFSKISPEFNESVVYLSFIKYCQFNSGVTLDDELQRLCVKNSAAYKSSDSLERKIDIMKSEGLNYSNDTLKALIHYISRQNIIHFDIDPPIITEKMNLELISEHLKEKNKIDIHNSEFIDILHQLIDRFDISYKDDKSSQSFIDEFNSKLDNWNEEMSMTITEKLHEHGELKRNHKDLILDYGLQSRKKTKKSEIRSERFILNWKLVGEEIYMYQDDQTGHIIFNMLKQMSRDMITSFPNIILNKVKKHTVPSHWNLSQRHVGDVNKIMERDYGYFTKYYGDKNINAISSYVLKHNGDLLMIMDAIPFYSKIMGDQPLNSIFNGKMVKKIGYYIFLSSIMLYLDAFESELDFETDDKTEEFGEELDAGLGAGLGVDDMILRGEREELEKVSCNLISNYLKMLESYKKTLNITPEEVTKNVLKSKEKEKAKITATFRDLADEERKVENIMKNHSLGDWGIGQTRAIYEYDENQYDKEREELEQQAIMELKSGVRDEVTEFSSEIYGLKMIDSENFDFIDQEDIQRQINAEVYNLSAIPEEDDDDREEIDYM